MLKRAAGGSAMIPKTFRQSLGVLILSTLVSMLGALVDGVIIGRLMGSTAMAAYGFAIPLTVIIAGIAGVAASGSQSLSGKALARGEPEEAEGYLSTALAGYAAIGLLLCAATALLRGPLSSLLGAAGGGEEIARDTEGYLLGFAPAIPAILLTQTASSYMYLENARKRALAAAAAGTAVNIAGDLVNVWVVHGGMPGMGLTTAISYYVMAGILLGHFAGPKHVLSVSPRRFSFRKLKELTVLGLPSADIQACSTVRTVFLNRKLLAIASGVAVSAFSVRMSMYNFYGAVVIGFGLATLLISSFFIGEENTDAMRETLKTALRDGVAVMIALCALVCALADPLCRIFSKDPEVIPLAADAVRFFAVSLPFYVINSVLAKYYQALGRHILSHVITILENLVYVCLATPALAGAFGVTGVWAVFLASEILTILTVVTYITVRNRRFPRSIDDLMLVPESMGAAPEEQYAAECRDPEEVQAAIDGLWSFLEGRGADKASAAKIVLCAEELTQNVIRQRGGRKDSRVSLRLTDKAEEWALCLRDTGSAFDPKLWLSTHAEEKGRYGLRLVDFAADDLSYVYTLNMNQIRIRIGKTGPRGA